MELVADQGAESAELFIQNQKKAAKQRPRVPPSFMKGTSDIISEIVEAKELQFQDHQDLSMYPDVPHVIHFYIAQQLVSARLIFLRKGKRLKKSYLVIRVSM